MDVEAGEGGGVGGEGKDQARSSSPSSKKREWERLPLRGSGTDVGGEWEAEARRAAEVTMPDVRLLNRLVHYLATSSKALEFKADQHLKVAKSGAGSGAAKSSSREGTGGGAGGGGGSSGKSGPATPRKRSSSAAAKRPKCSEEVDIQEVAEERKLGVITDRQESGAIALVQTWAEAVAGLESPPPDHPSWRTCLTAALKELPKQALACSPSTWTFWERKMLCAALLAQGAPSSNNDDTIHPGIVRLMQGREPFDTSMDGMDMEVMKGFTWESIIARANLTRTPDDVAHYYVKHFLPLCVELCRPDAVAGHKAAAAAATAAAATATTTTTTDTASGPTATSATTSSEGTTAAGAAGAAAAAAGDAATAAPAASSASKEGGEGGGGDGAAAAAGAGTEGTDPLSFFPDPTRDVLEHSPVARGVAYIFLKRQQLLRTMRFFLYKRKDAVAQWSRNQQSAQINHEKEGLPMWWCPWIHDLGLMAGCVRHGFMNINAMRSDTTLPLHPSSVQDHITRALIVGVEDPMSHMDEDFPTAGVAPAVPPPAPVIPPTLPLDGAKGFVGGGEGGEGVGGVGVGGVSGGGGAYSLASAVAVAAAAVRAGKGFDGTDEAVQAWAEESSSEFPTRRSAEERVFRICVALTKLMPLSNPLRVRCYNERWA